MSASICLSLTCSTLKEDLSLVLQYKKRLQPPQLLELRVDMLKAEEVFYVSDFPSLVDLPTILTIRRERDGGAFSGGEYARALMFSRCLNVAPFKERSFAYIDLEDDFCVDELEEICDILKIKIIRSHHSISSPILDFERVVSDIKKTRYDIIKIASFSSSLLYTKMLFEKGGMSLKNDEHILVAMGRYGLSSRILSDMLSSKWVYVFSQSEIEKRGWQDEMLSMDVLLQNYNFYDICKDFSLFGIIGGAVNNTKSIAYHNAIFKKHSLKCAYIPLSAKNIEEAIGMAQFLNFRGLSVTSPFKIEAMQYATEISDSAKMAGSCNTLIFSDTKPYRKIVAHNTDIAGFERALREFLSSDFSCISNVSVLGAGGAARAVCYVLKKCGFKEVVVFNRTYEKAATLANIYNFEVAPLDSSSLPILREHSDLIINASAAGRMIEEGNAIDILPFYKFEGREKVFDLVYNCHPSGRMSPFLERAKDAGCKVLDGSLMFLYQAMEQEALFREVL